MSKSSTQMEHFTSSYIRSIWLVITMADLGLNRKSSQNFRVRAPPGEHILRGKVRVLEEQVEALQSGLTMFAQIKSRRVESKDEPKLPTKCGHQKEIGELRARVDRLQNKNKLILGQKKCLQNSLAEALSQNQEYQLQVSDLQKQLEGLEAECKVKDSSIFELGLQNKYLKEEKSQLTAQLQKISKHYQLILNRIGSVENNTLVEIALKYPLILVKQDYYKELKDSIFKLKKRINELELEKQWAKSTDEFAKRKESAMLQIPNSNIGEEIVRLKKNIDMQIGGDTKSQFTETFLHKYKEVQKILGSLSK